MSVRILVVDNYDSFVFNLVQYLGQLGVECDVRRNDEITVDEIGALAPAGVLLSPGPGTPERAGICIGRIRVYGGSLPIFGVCLGHQAIGAAFGATVTRAPELLHGKTSLVTHDGTGVLAGLPDPFIATRYHSLAVVEYDAARRDRGDRPDRVRCGHGDAPPRAADRGRPVPPRVGAHPGRPPDAGELARGLRPDRTRSTGHRRWSSRGRDPPPGRVRRLSVGSAGQPVPDRRRRRDVARRR